MDQQKKNLGRGQIRTMSALVSSLHCQDLRWPYQHGALPWIRQHYAGKFDGIGETYAKPRILLH